MSSKVKKIANKLSDEAIKDVAGKTAVYRIDFEIAIAGVLSMKSATVEVSGIPKEFKHEEYDNLAKHTAQTTFCNVINQRAFLETYPQGETAKTASPKFINLFKSVDDIQIKEAVWLEEKE